VVLPEPAGAEMTAARQPEVFKSSRRASKRVRSTSCGLAVKVTSEGLGESAEILRQNRVQVDGAYRVSELQGKTRAERVIDG
jgi:hypothetical protein